MPDHVDSVKEYVRLMETWRASAVSADQQSKIDMYDKRLTFLNGLVEEVEELRRITKPIPASYGDLSDLPPELVKELTGIKVDELEQQLFTVISAGGSEVDLDAILIELYRRFKVLQTRKFLQNKLWRMVQKGVIYSVAGRKGIYSAKDDGTVESPKPRNPLDDDLDSDIPF